MKCECETEAVEHEFTIVFSSKIRETDGETYICNLMQWFNIDTTFRILKGSWCRETIENEDGTDTSVVKSEIKMRSVSDTHNVYDEKDLIVSKLWQSYEGFVHKYYPDNPLAPEQITGIDITCREI